MGNSAHRLQSLLVALSLAVCSAVSAAEVPAKASLYGLQPGTEMRDVRALYGEPDIRHPFDDGWVVFGYQFDGHNLIVQTAPDDPEYVRSVQIEGGENPPGKGLLGIDLGDNVDEALRAFGEPEKRRPAIDAITKEPVPNTWFIGYTNVSFEVVNGAITSIKLHFPSRKAAETARLTS